MGSDRRLGARRLAACLLLAACLAACGDDAAPPVAPAATTAPTAPTAPAVGTIAPPPRAAAPEPPPVPPGTAFAVVVRSADGAPLRHAAIAVHPREPDDRSSWSSGGYLPTREVEVPVATFRTGDAGTAALTGIATGRWRLVVQAAGHARTEIESAWVAGDAPRELTVTLEPAHALVVAVRTHDGRPLAGTAVVVADPGTQSGPALSTRTWRGTTDASGACRLDGLPRGDFAAWYDAGGGRLAGDVAVRIPGASRVDLVTPVTGTLEGRVVDERGAGVSGAQVVFLSDRWMSFAHHVGEATTVADGAYRAPTFRAWGNVERIEVRAPGFATIRTEVPHAHVAADETHRFEDLVLVPEGRLRGTLAGPDGPVGDARIEVWVRGTGPFGEMESESTRTAADGTWALGGLAAGTVVVTASAPGLVQEGAGEYGRIGDGFGMKEGALASIPETAKAVIAEGRETALDVRMVRTADSAEIHATLTGVVRREDGTPVPWADVWASGATNRRWISDAGRTVSAADGTFRVEAEAASGFDLYASAPGLSSERTPVEMKESGARDGVEVVVTPAPLVRGTVRSKLGLPVAGAVVRVASQHYHKGGEAARWDESAPVRVAADGSFVLPLGPRQSFHSDADAQGDALALCAEAPGHAPAISRTFTWDDAAQGAIVDLELDAGASVSVRVTDDSGAPVADAAVSLSTTHWLWSSTGWPPVYPAMANDTLVGRTGRDGGLRIDHLLPATWRIAASAPGFTSESTEVAAGDGAAADLRLVRTHDLSGVVVTPDGAPVAGAEVSIAAAGGNGGPRRTTDAAGTFRFRAIAAGKWKVTVVPGEAAASSLQPRSLDDVAAGTTNLRIVMRAGLRIEGTLLDAAGAPVSGAEIAAVRTDDLPGGWRDATTDDAGRFVVTGLAPGAHTLSCHEQGLEFGTHAAGASPTLRIPGTLTITGRTSAPQGVAGVSVGFRLRARRTDAPEGAAPIVHLATTEDDGTFAFRHLAAGRYAIEADSGWARSEDGSTSWKAALPSPVVAQAGATEIVLVAELRNESKQ